MVKIKYDSELGIDRESDVNYRYNQDIIDNTAIIDNFNEGTPDDAYAKINSTVYSYSQAYINKMLKVHVNTGGLNANGIYNKYAIGKNFIQRVWGKNYNNLAVILN